MTRHKARARQGGRFFCLICIQNRLPASLVGKVSRAPKMPFISLSFLTADLLQTAEESSFLYAINFLCPAIPLAGSNATPGITPCVHNRCGGHMAAASVFRRTKESSPCHLPLSYLICLSLHTASHAIAIKANWGTKIFHSCAISYFPKTQYSGTVFNFYFLIVIEISVGPDI